MAVMLFALAMVQHLILEVAALGHASGNFRVTSGHIQSHANIVATGAFGALNEATNNAVHNTAAAQDSIEIGSWDTSGLSPSAAFAACSKMGSWDGLQQEMLLSEDENFELSRRNRSQQAHVHGLVGHEKIVMSPHHKTGFVFSKQALRCINANEPGSGGFIMAYMLRRQAKFLNNAKVIHFTRDPLKLLVSTYLYNKEIADTIEHEPQIMAAGSALWAKNIIQRNGMSVDFMVTRPAETLREHLKRVSVRSGLKVVLLSTLPEWENIESSSEWCRANSACKEVSLDHITASTNAYNKVWGEIYEFAGITPTQNLKSCLAMQDVNFEKFHSSRFSHHCSSGKVPDTLRSELEKQCIVLDKEILQGRYTNVSIKYRFQHRLVQIYGLPQ